MAIAARIKKMFFTYILYSSKFDSYYIGYTSDLDKRLNRHNKGMVSSTKSKRPWMLLYFEKYSSRSKAINRERHLKRMKNKKFIEYLISQ